MLVEKALEEFEAGCILFDDDGMEAMHITIMAFIEEENVTDEELAMIVRALAKRYKEKYK